MEKISPLLKPHYNRFQKCRQCLIGCVSDVRVFYKGPSRCDVLFIGDAPTDIDIALGEPFSDKAGKMLDDLISQSGLNKYRLGFTNTVVCVPSNSLGGKLRTPKTSETKNCSLRLNHLIGIVKPKQLVSVGSQAEKGVKLLNLDYTQLTHPNKILMLDENGEIEFARCLKTLKDVKRKLNV
jgi:DNA polymerase